MIVTGGEGDLAAAIAAEFGKGDYDILSPGRRELDVLDESSVTRFFQARERVDLLINNAGLTNDGPFARQGPDQWNSVIDTCLKGTHLCSRAAAALMIRQRSGHIVNIGSFSADHPQAGQVAYAAAKAGLVALTKSYAMELGKRNIRVNCVLPGFLETKMTENLSAETREAALKRHALGRFTTLEEAAAQIRFLATCENISGQIFQLDSRG